MASKLEKINASNTKTKKGQNDYTHALCEQETKKKSEDIWKVNIDFVTFLHGIMASREVNILDGTY